MLLVLNQSPLSTIFAIVRFPGGAKFVLSGDPLYILSQNDLLVIFKTHTTLAGMYRWMKLSMAPFYREKI